MAKRKFLSLAGLSRLWEKLVDYVDSSTRWCITLLSPRSTESECFMLVYTYGQETSLPNQPRITIPNASTTQAGVLTAAAYEAFFNGRPKSLSYVPAKTGIELCVNLISGDYLSMEVPIASTSNSGFMSSTQVSTLESLKTWKGNMPSLAPSLTTGFSGDVTTLQGASGVSVVSTNGDSVTGLPSDAPSKYGLLLCCGFGSTNQLQVFFTFSHPCYIYSRQKLGGTWRDWCKLVPGTSSASVMSLMDDMGIALPDASVADDATQEESVDDAPQQSDACES